jgi:hypothetical protein
MATLPEFLFDFYKRYKDDNQAVITWLGETAEELNQKASSKKSKSKHRKIHQHPTYQKFPLKDLLFLARSISEFDPPIEIPRIVFQNLKRVIVKRQKCADWFSKQTDDDIHHQNNKGHTHTINVLQEVQGILSGNVNWNRSKLSGVTVGAAVDTEFANSFDGPHLEDEISDIEPSAPSTSRKMHIPSNPKTTYEAEYATEDYQFDIYCFLGDFNNIRNYLITI